MIFNHDRYDQLGFTLAETAIGLFTLGLLMAMTFGIYRSGALAWQSGESDAQLSQSAQVFTDRLTREASRTTTASITLDPMTAPSTAIAFLSPWDPARNLPDYDPISRSPIWHSYSVFHWSDSDKVIRTQNLPLGTPTTAVDPLFSLAAQRSGGILLCAEVEDCEFSLVESLIEVRLVLERKRYGKETPDRIEVLSSVAVRN